ncbi:hypothetical protein [Streptomyces sp. NPDC056600]|uniref:hypothetical protein n=1 Tax=Streptomyces sp. NPDC056600 TaxID=3345874 RepID=UPI00367C19E8
MRGERRARRAWVIWLLLPAVVLVGCGRKGGRFDIDLPGGGSDGGTNSGSGGYGAGGAETTTGPDPVDTTQDAFRAVTAGTCLPVNRTGEQWSRPTPPDPVSCRTERADLFHVDTVHTLPATCPSGVGRAEWTHRSSITGETTTLCLDRVWVKNYCVLAEQEGDKITSIGDTTAVDCDATKVSVPYNQVLVVSGAYKAPPGANADDCVTGAGDRRWYWSLLADDGDTLVCFTQPDVRR